MYCKSFHKISLKILGYPWLHKFIQKLILGIALYAAQSLLSQLSNRMKYRENWFVDTAILLSTNCYNCIHQRNNNTCSPNPGRTVHHTLLIIWRLYIPLNKVVKHHFKIACCDCIIWNPNVWPSLQMYLCYVLLWAVGPCNLQFSFDCEFIRW